MAILALFIGILGISGMTWIFPALGRAHGARKEDLAGNGERQTLPSRKGVEKVAILLPVHDEEELIGRTLASIAAAAARAAAVHPSVEIETIVGADFCRDATIGIASRWGARVISSTRRIGKWRMLRDLVKAADGADWVILADAGVVWPQDLLNRVLPLFARKDLVGVAPAYRIPDAGPLERLYWALETKLKKMEAAIGGPISLHGATVAYRRAPLARAIAGLGNRNWVNDDVVIPLALRTVNPGMRIAYLDDVIVHDSSHTSRGSRSVRKEFNRRLRIASGNAQWIRKLFASVWRTDTLVGTLAMRRVFRLFWAYWLLMLLAFVTLVAPELIAHSAVPMLVVLACASLLAPVRMLFQAAIASLIAPIFLVVEPAIGRTVWK